MSTFPELKGIMFPGPDARILAEKKILREREEKARIEEEERRKAEEEAAAKAAKAQRIEEKRLEAERRLQDLAKKKAEEDEREAEALRQQTIAKKAEEEAAAKRAAERAKKEAEFAAQKAREQARREEEEAREKQRQLEQEKEEKRKAQADKQKEEDINAEKRWLKQQVAAGKVKVAKTKSGFVVAPTDPANAPKIDGSLSWIKVVDDLDVPVEEDEEELERQRKEKEEKERKPKLSFGLAGDKDRPNNDSSWISQENKYIENAIKSHTVKPLNETRMNIRVLADRLDSRDERFAALLELFSFLVTVLRDSGIAALRSEISGMHALQECIQGVANMLKEAPGNVMAMMVLGLIAFSGDENSRAKVQRVSAIPNTVEEWIGWMLGSRLYFEFVTWKEAGSKGTWTLDCESTPGSPGKPKSYEGKQKEATEAKILNLIDALGNAAYINTGDVATIMAKYPIICDRFASSEGELGQFLNQGQETAKTTIEEATRDPQLEGLRSQVERARFAMQDAQKELKRAQDKLNQHHIDIQRHEAKSSVAKERIKALKLEAIQVERERQEAMRQLKSMGVKMDEEDLNPKA